MEDYWRELILPEIIISGLLNRNKKSFVTISKR